MIRIQIRFFFSAEHDPDPGEKFRILTETFPIHVDHVCVEDQPAPIMKSLYETGVQKNCLVFASVEMTTLREEKITTLKEE